MSHEDPLRALWRSNETDTKEMPTMSLEVVRERSAKLDTKASRRNLAEWISGGVSVVVLAVVALQDFAPYIRLACLLLVVGELFVIVTLWQRGVPSPAPRPDASTAAHLAHYRAELARERDLRRSVGRWYVAPVFPGLVALPVAISLTIGAGALVVGLVSFASVALVYAIIVAVNQRTARRLTRELESLAE